jgi:SAM-dependent methyltransferase
VSGDAASPPFPPVELMRRVAPLDSDARDAADDYDAAGLEVKQFIVSQLPESWTWEGKRVLDFGCGAGRVLRHFLPEAHHAEFWGSEIDEPSVRWIEQHLSPPLRVVHHGESPPLRAPAGHFDLIYAMSVFTHITDEWSAWLLELHRLLAPEGLLLASFIGRDMIGPLTGERWSDDRIGLNVTRCGASWAEGGPNTFISPWWLRAHWGRAFEIVRLEPEGYASGDPRGLNGFALLRRKPVEIGRDDLEAPERGEPRELHAARHNVRQLARELTRVRDRLDRVLADNRRLAGYLESSERHWRGTAEWWEQVAESILQSRTWRLTEPLRRLAARLTRRAR